MIENIARYNFWNGNAPELGFPRTSYTGNLERYIGNRLIKVLVGQRRSGKSYIMRQLAWHLISKGTPPNNILYINKEYIEYQFLQSHDDLEQLFIEYKTRLAPQGKIYLFIDEVQYIDQWERFVNSHSQDFTEQCEIFLSGSNSKLLSGELATLLSGRYVQFEILPYSFAEYCGISNIPQNRDSYLRYIHTGGMPELFNLPDEDMKRNYISSLKDTIMLRDIVQRYKIKEAKLLEDIFCYLINNAASLVSITNIIHWFDSKKRKTNYETLSAYIGYLKNSFLIHQVERYNIRGKEAIAGNQKYYANDLSYKNYLYSGVGYGDGWLLENAVFLELKRKGYAIWAGNIERHEVDFVAKRGDETIYCQVALSLNEAKTYEREYNALKSIPDHFRKYVVTLDDYPIPSDEGIEHLCPWQIP